jgi:hypothetical protein
MTNNFQSSGLSPRWALLLSTPAFAADGVKINEVVVAASIPDAQRARASTRPARSAISGTPAMTLC